MPTPVTTAAAFLQMVCFNTHFPYGDGTYAQYQNDIAQMEYLNSTVQIARDGISNGPGAPGQASLAAFDELAKGRIKFIASTGGGKDTPTSLAAGLANIDQVAQTVPGSIVAVEGPNEVNNYPVSWTPTTGGATLTGVAGEQAIQAAIYAEVGADANLVGVPVVEYTGQGHGTIPDPLTGLSAYPGVASSAQVADFENSHPYPGTAAPPAGKIARSVAYYYTATPNLPGYFTETGYTTNVHSEHVQAAYSLDLLADASAEGITEACLYDLNDAYAPVSYQGDDGWGLFDYLSHPKAAAFAIHNLTSLLVDKGAGGAHYAAFAPTVVGGLSLVVQKSSGENDILVWAEPTIWNAKAPVGDLDPAPTKVSITLPTIYGTVQVFDPMAGLAPVATYNDVSVLSVEITDHPLVLEVSPAGATFVPIDNASYKNTTAGSETVAIPVALAPTASSDAAAQLTVKAQGYVAAFSAPPVESPRGASPQTLVEKLTVPPGASYFIHGHNVTYGPATVVTP